MDTELQQYKKKLADITISVGVRDLLQVKEMCGHSYFTNVGIIKDLNFDPSSKGRKLLDERDLLIPHW